MKEAIVAFLIALVVGAAINGINGAGHDANPSPQEKPAANSASAGDSTAEDPDALPQTSDQTWQSDVLKGSQPVLVDFYGEACPECTQMLPVVKKLAAEFKGKAKFYRLDVDRNAFTVSKYNIASIPSYIIFKDGKRADYYTGIVPHDALSSALNKVLQ